MNPEEALNQILLLQNIIDDTSLLYEALEVAKDCIEKQIPEEPIKNAYDDNNFYMCPSCNSFVNPNINYCLECGKKLERRPILWNLNTTID